MAGEEFIDLVRFRNDGEDFHINWTTRRTLRILGREGLTAVAVEGISDSDRFKGRRIAAGLLVADTVEYYGGENLDAASRIVLNQLKYSTQHQDTAWPWGDIEPVLREFAARYRAIARKAGVKVARSKLCFRFITNRPVSSNVLQAVDYLAGRSAKVPKGHAGNAMNAIPAATGLNGKGLSAFLTLVELGVREQSRESIAARVAVEANDLLPAISREPVTVLRDLVRRFGTTSHGQDPTIRRETVLQAFGIDDPEKLFPAAPEFELVPNAVVRRQEPDLVAAIRQAQRPILVTASGGTGKSIIAQRIPGLLPLGSEAVVFDGFAGGRYRDPSERRHLHQVGLVQLANELAGKGLCDILLPTAASDRDFIVSFRDRLQQAAALVRKRSPDALLVVVLDAADNSVFAARLYREDAFVSSLLAEAPPEGCRVVALARPERLEGLHADKVQQFPLEGFDLKETGRFVRRFDPGAARENFETFRRLTFGNPRVQANQLALAGSLDAAIVQLGPGGLSVEKLIEDQLEKGLFQVRDAQPEADVDALCVGLAALPPMVPIRILAEIAGFSEAQITSFASDFGGGRPLMLREGALQFRDEPVEKWFNDRFVADEAAAGRFVDRLAPIAEKDAYAALALPQLMLRAGRHASLMHLALASDPGFADKPVERQAIVLQQVRFGLRSALELDEMASVAKLFVRAGEQIAASERQERFLEENADLVPLLSGPEVTEDFVHRRRGGNWFGAVNAYKAEMLSVMPETRDEARGFLYLAGRWLDEWSRRARMRDPDDWPGYEDQLGDDDISAMLFAACMLDGAAAGASFADDFDPGEFRFKFTYVCARKLLDAGQREMAEGLLAELRTGETRIAVHLAMRWRGLAPSRREVERTLAALADVEIRDQPFGYDDSDFADALLTVAESAVEHGLTAEALALLGRGDWSLSSHPLPDVGGRIERAMRAAALRAAITGDEPTVETLWQESHRRSTRSLDPIRPDYRDIHARLLPTFLLRAKILSGQTVNVPAELAGIKQTRSLIGFDPWQERQFRGTRMMAEVDLLLRAGLLDVPQLQACESRAVRDGRLWQHECLALIGLLTPHTLFHGELIRLGAVAAESGEDAHDDAEVRTGNLAAIARKLLPISREESAVYFRKALEEADRVGEELHERLQMLLVMGQSVAGGPGVAEYGYRILRLAELYGQINSHKYPWDDVFQTLATMHAPTAISAVSRLDSRERVNVRTSLAEVGEVLLQEGAIGIPQVAALHAFGGVWDFKDLPAKLAALPAADTDMVAGMILRDMVDDQREAWNMRAFVGAAEALSLVPPDVRAIYERRKASEERSTSQHVPSPDPVIDHAALVAGRNVLDPLDLAMIVEAFRREARFGAALDPMGTAIREHVPVADRIAHLRAVAASDIDMEDILQLLSLAGSAWAPSIAVKEALRTIAIDLIERRPFDLLSYHWHRSLKHLQALTGDESSVLLRLLVKTTGPKIDDLGSSTLFWLARQVHADLLAPEVREQVLAFALDRFEAVLSPEEPDGAWRPELRPAGDVRTALAALIWTSLGDPSPRRRWRAAHAVRRLARLGERDLLEAILARLSDPEPGASLDPRLPFYAEHARTFLLIAIARIAIERPDMVTTAIPRLRELADRAHRHVFQRYWAAQALLALAAAGVFVPETSERRALRRPFASDPSAPAVPAPARRGQEDRGYRYPMDFDRREADPIAKAFGIAPAELRERVAQAIRNNLGREPTEEYAGDPRSGLGIYDRRYHGGPENERLATYEAWHGLCYAIGDLLEGRPRAPDLIGDDGYMLRDHFLSAPPQWLSDRRDPDPTVAWPVSAVPPSDSNWEWSVTPADFETALFEGVDRIRLAGSWTRYSSLAREDGAVATALVRPDFAVDLLRACQTYSGRFPWIPLEGDTLDLGFQKMRVVPWITKEERPGGIDSLDPFSGDIQGAHVPGALMRRRLGLTPSDDRRVWSSNGPEPKFELRSTIWGEAPNDYRDERLDHGDTLTAPLDRIVETLAEMERSLIVRVRLDRYGGAKDKEPNTYARYFILGGDGELHWLGGHRRAWPPADAGVGGGA